MCSCTVTQKRIEVASSCLSGLSACSRGDPGYRILDHALPFFKALNMSLDFLASDQIMAFRGTLRRTGGFASLLIFLTSTLSQAVDQNRLGDLPPSSMPYRQSRFQDAKAGPWKSADPGATVMLENAHAKVMIWPEAGGAITEYVNKATETNFVAGKVEPGKAVYGWKEMTRISHLDATGDWMSALPHYYRQVETPAGSGIEVARISRGVESRRVIVLDPESSKLSVAVHLANCGKEPRRLFPRWHPYSMAGDPFAESSGIYVPESGQVLAKIRVGVGFDNTFPDPKGWVMAANANSGEGLWVTYSPENATQITTFTDYKFGVKHPMRGAFTLEPWVEPIWAAPGESMGMVCTYFPFVRETLVESLPLDEIPAADHAEARRFAALVKPNLEILWDHSMMPKDAGRAEAENRFDFWVTRPDRMALRDWGIADAFFSMPGIQEKKARVRYVAHLFPSAAAPKDLEFGFFMEDALGKRIVNERQTAVFPEGKRGVDLRIDPDLSGIPDGRYRVGVEILEQGRQIYNVTQSRMLVGQRRAEMIQSRPSPLAESPFVKALRQVDFHAEKPGDFRIPIGIEEASGIARTQWPVFTGVPFARGMLRSDAQLRLLNNEGKEVPFDSTVSGTWDDGSVRWVLLRFSADIPASGFVFYELKPGKSRLPKAGDLLQQNGETISFDNGSQQWQWDGADKLGPIRAEDLWWTNGEGRQYIFQLRGEGAGVEIEENGSCRALVKVTGWYFAEGKEQPVARGILRFEGFRSQPHLRVSHNVTFAGSPWSQTIRSFGLRMPLPAPHSRMFKIELDGKTLSAEKSFSVDQIDDATCRLVVDGKAQIGRRASGVFAFPLEKGDRTIFFRDFWKMFPKRASVESAGEGAVEFSYWPEFAGNMNFIPEGQDLFSQGSVMEDIGTGMSRTHEFVISDGSTMELDMFGRLFDEPTVAIVPPRYLAQTETMLHLQPYDPELYPEVEKTISETFDSYIIQQDLWGWRGQWVYGALRNMFVENEYRWMDHGRAAWILNEMNIVQTPWLAYMRSGDRKYLKFAETNTRQLQEVSTIHLTGVWPEFQGLSRRHEACVWFGLGDFGHSMLDPFLERYRMTGERSAWDAALAMADAMGRIKSGELYKWRYISNPLAGLSRMYLETQNPKYKYEAERVWKELCFPDQNDWWSESHGDRAAMYYSKIDPQCAALIREWTQNDTARFSGMDILSMLYLETKDTRYANAALEEFRKFEAERNSRTKDDPLMLGLSKATQSTLTTVRQMMYAGSTLRAAIDIPKKENP